MLPAPRRGQTVGGDAEWGGACPSLDASAGRGRGRARRASRDHREAQREAAPAPTCPRSGGALRPPERTGVPCASSHGCSGPLRSGHEAAAPPHAPGTLCSSRPSSPVDATVDSGWPGPLRAIPTPGFPPRPQRLRSSSSHARPRGGHMGLLTAGHPSSNTY